MQHSPSTTKICPSQAAEAPMPMVGTEIRWVMARARTSVVFSITTLNAPASVTASASSMIAAAASLDRPRTA
jgi:hypothetical protein